MPSALTNRRRYRQRQIEETQLWPAYRVDLFTVLARALGALNLHDAAAALASSDEPEAAVSLATTMLRHWNRRHVSVARFDLERILTVIEKLLRSNRLDAAQSAEPAHAVSRVAPALLARGKRRFDTLGVDYD